MTGAAAAGRRRRPTLKSVAAEVGLAVTTVSRALNDAPDIGAGTKERVREAAARVGYVRDRAAHRLRTGRTNVISLLMTPETDALNHTARLIHGLAAELRGTGYHLIVTPVFDDEDPLVPLRYVVETGSADAVVINKIRPEDPRIAYMREAGLPFATHGRSAMGIEHPFYDFDNAAFAALALRALARRGRRRTLIVAPPLAQSYARHIVEGARVEAAILGIGTAVLEGATTDSPLESMQEAIRAALATGRFDAVMTASALSGLAADGAAETLGLTVGVDLDVVAKEAQSVLERVRPAIISVREDMSAAGSFLARAALQAIREPGRPPMTHLAVPGEGDVSAPQAGTTRRETIS